LTELQNDQNWNKRPESGIHYPDRFYVKLNRAERVANQSNVAILLEISKQWAEAHANHHL